MKKSFAIITTCRGRLQHLKQTLPHMLAQGADEIIVVDYDCPEGTGDWVEANHPDVKVLRAKDPLGYSAPKSRNLGAAHATADWLCMVDADGIPQPGWLQWLDDHLSDDDFSHIADEGQPDLSGIMVASRKNFEAAGGYDEAMRGWGGEDNDLRNRFAKLGLRRVYFPNDLVHAIPHGDDIRDTLELRSRELMRARNAMYIRAKRRIVQRFGSVDLCCRTSLITEINEHVRARGTPDDMKLYPVRFLRYCPSCAKRFGNNEVLVLELRRKVFFGRLQPVLKSGRKP